MTTLSKMLLFAGLVMLLVAFARMGSAHPISEDIGIEQRSGDPPSGVPVGMLISEQGTACKDNKTYALRIIVECLIPIEPSRVQMLLASNKSLEEIRDAIGSEQGAAIYRGNMLLDEIVYPLINIRLAPFADNVSTLEADVSKPIQDPALINEIVIVGHIHMIIEPSEGGNTGRGELSMNDSHYFGTHAILIDILTPCEKGMERRRDNGDMQEAPRHPLRLPSDQEA